MLPLFSTQNLEYLDLFYRYELLIGYAYIWLELTSAAVLGLLTPGVAALVLPASAVSWGNSLLILLVMADDLCGVIFPC